MGATTLILVAMILVARLRDHDAYLLRWDEADFAAGRLDAPEWWNGGVVGWVPHSELAGIPAAVFRDAQTELTVSDGVLPDRLTEDRRRRTDDAPRTKNERRIT